MNTARRVRFLVVWACGFAATGPALLVAALAARLAGLDGAQWSTWVVMVVIVAIVAPFTFAAGRLSGPLVSRLQNWIERRVSVDEHTK